MTAFTSPVFALTTTATSCMKLYRCRPEFRNANTFLIPTFVRVWVVVVVSETAARAMLLAEKSVILPACFLACVFSVLLISRHYSRLSGEDGRKAKRRRKLSAATVLSACFLLPRSAWQDLKKAAVLTWT